MTIKAGTLLLLISLIISGCASHTQLVGHQVSNLDINADIDPDTPIIVVTGQQGDALTNKRYLPDLANALEKQGFNTVSNEAEAEYQLIADFHSEVQTRTKKVPVFNNARNIPYTTCYRHPDTGKQRCITRFQHFQAPIVSGYQTIEVDVTVYTLDLILRDKQGALLLESTHRLSSAECSKWFMFAFLAEESVKNINLSDPVDRHYQVTLPEDTSCH
ncbi:hypothetical protein [Marinomonas algarum]|uniref:Lipoprotein n=1 Tax=Marinomonas algarum TaxID=2883105 RepID=A0A9X1IKU1_9GAMM|nr:hypothetical protein [Marinomonas algarum]MCB5161092.1 hypothetical protein [Marinomonas algarum]